MFELYKDKAGEYRFRLKAGNGENILASEGYTSKGAAENGIVSIKENASEENSFDLSEAGNGKWHFNLKAGNGQIIGTSQMYTDRPGAVNGMKSVTENADGDVDDQTGE